MYKKRERWIYGNTVGSTRKPRERQSGREKKIEGWAKRTRVASDAISVTRRENKTDWEWRRMIQ